MNQRRSRASDAIEEAIALLHGLRFARDHGAYVRGAHSSVTVSTIPLPAIHTHRIHIACYMPGNLEVLWNGLAIFLEDDVTGDYWLAFLNAFGKTEFHVASGPDRYYTLSSSRTAAELSGGADETRTRIASADGLVHASLRRSGSQSVVEFETDNARVARDRIHFLLSDGHGKVLLKRDGVFETSHMGSWAARFELEAGVPTDAIFRFAVVSPRR
jgi:hypothetical protein